MSDMLELRLHGIGNRQYQNALGIGRHMRQTGRVLTEDAPRLPGHRVRIVNWARGNRRAAQRAGWYLAFPFTLINILWFLHPAGRRSGYLTLSAHLMSLLLTLTAYFWAIASVETVLVRLPIHTDPVVASWWVAIGVAVAYWAAVGVAWSRQGRRERALDRDSPIQDNPKTHSILTRFDAVPTTVRLTHCLAIAVAAVLVATIRPATLSWNAWPSSPEVPTPLSLELQSTVGARLDVLPLLAATTVVIAVVLSVPLLVAAARAARRGRGSVGTNWSAAALALTAAPITLVAILALLRMAVDSLASLIAAAFSPGQMVAGTWVGLVLPVDDRTTFQDNRIDFLPAHAVLLGAVLVVSAISVSVIRYRRVAGDREAEPRESDVVWWRRVSRAAVNDIGTVSWQSLVLTMLVGGALSVGGVVFLESRRAEPVFPVLYLAVSLLATAMALAVLLAQFSRAREIVNRVGDVLGFWPARGHPLAAASYRPDITRALRVELNDAAESTRVLVAHSQGSALALWLLISDASVASTPQRPLHLMTAGSPVASIYLGLFPHHVDERMLNAARGRVASWANAWRLTDPVSGELSSAENLLLDDPRPDGPTNPTTGTPIVLGHRGYWDDPEIAEWVATRGSYFVANPDADVIV